jgi:hypothetical protein
MGFRRKVKEQALTAAARHCCVCHRYKGVRIEVHHIVPKSEGGKDDLENAIALCFDCHTDAGHYNPKHPKGTKFRPSELRGARDKWHDIVKQQGLTGPTEENTLHTRYLICKDTEIAEEILSRDLTGLPNSEHPLLFENDVSNFMKWVLNDSGYRRDYVWGERYDSIEEYQSAHPNARVLNQEKGLEYFKAQRTPTREEIVNNVAPEDKISLRLLDAGFEPESVVSSLVYWEVCGDASLQEIYRLRPFWAVFLAAKNTTNRQVSLEELIANENERGRSDITPVGVYEKEISLPLPRASIAPGSDVIIPVSALLGPFHRTKPKKEFFEEGAYPKERVQRQVTQFVSYSKEQREQFRVWGPALYPIAFILRDSGASIRQEVHEFDLTRTYTVNRFWEMGSCPHLFFEMSDGPPIYWGELFAREPETVIEEKITAPNGAVKASVAELEQEKTHILLAKVEEQLVAEDVTLETGQTITFSVQSGEQIYISGSYSPYCTEDLKPQPWRRNEVVSDWLCNATSLEARDKKAV